ncbi:MAG TPA: hypothetical protein DCZ51_03695 [Bacteroidales bacterium]|nr:hypothetical protein [Bacteroidales bacterium]
MNTNRNILICPLEWGLGHAGRMIPVARKLRERNYNVIIGSGKEHQAMFRNELPGLTYIDFPGFKPDYSRFLPQYISLLLKMPLLLYHIAAEHMMLKRIINENKIDIILSDNRFGLWNRRIKSVYVTHQMVIPFPRSFRFLEWTGILFHRYFIKKYSLCFIPDLPGDINLSGRLSHGIRLPENTRYIGLLSRFTGRSQSVGNRFGIPHNTVILSGPEPQRGVLRQKLIEILSKREPLSVFLEGKPGDSVEMSKSENIISYNHLPANEMQDMITGSTGIVTRSGYTSVMELISLKCSALLIPTPGQPEQEYLAEYLSGKGWFGTISQDLLNEGAIPASLEAVWPSYIFEESSELLDKALDELLNK